MAPGTSSLTGRSHEAVPRSRGPWLVGAGVVALVGAAMAWTAVAAAASGGRAGPPIGILAASGASFLVATVLTRVRRWIVPGAVAAAAGAMALTGSPFDTGHPLAGPFGYLNASGTFFALAAIAALMIAVEQRSPAGRLAAGAAAAGAFAVTVAEGSAAAALLGVVLPALALGATRLWGARTAVVVLAALLAATLVLTAWVASTYRPGERGGAVARMVDATLTERRAALWNEAIDLIGAHPAAGVGPGRFAEESGLARADADARWAHNGFLQHGAETGVLGLVTLVLLFALGILVPGMRAAADAYSALGAAALTALGIGACVDYLFHFPGLSVTAAALAGAASGERSLLAER